MATNNPRINVVLEEPIYKAVGQLAKRDGVSLSAKVRDLVKEAIELHEDIVLAEIGTRREKNFVRNRAISHNEVWSILSRKQAA